MGIGVRRGDELDIVAVAQDPLTPAQWARWRRAFTKASELLHDATQGQLRLGRIYLADDANGIGTADAVLHSDGDPSYSSGRFGDAGAAIHLMPYTQREVLTIVHELGHHLFGLIDEYTQVGESDSVDDTSPAPDLVTIPIEDSGRPDGELTGREARAILVLSAGIERRRVIADTATSITVDADYSSPPTDAPTVWFQFPADCADADDADFCPMARGRSSAGTLEPDGTWIPATHPVTEFCAPSNHDPDGDTAQEAVLGESCWETITSSELFGDLTLADPGTPGPGGAPEPTFYVLDPDPRFGVLLDRSGSMEDGTKLPDAQHGATYWVEFCAVASDALTVSSYNHAVAPLLDLVDVGDLSDAQRQTVIEDIADLEPDGGTNILDALLDATTQLTTPPTRSATQVVLLLTDGRHNTPWWTVAQEAIPVLGEQGVRVYAIGVGDATEVDLDTLDDITSATGGRTYAVGTDRPDEIETAMVEINAEVRGGIIESLPVELPTAGPDAEIDERTAPIVKGRKRTRPPTTLFEGTDRVTDVRVFVEEGAGRASFTLLHPASSQTWLTLIDPSGNEVPIGATGHSHVRSPAPHEFSVVVAPKPGWWTCRLTRPLPGPPITCRLIAGVENRHLSSWAQADANAELGAQVGIVAGVRSGAPLTGCKVVARLRSPSGALISTVLQDDAGGEATGRYIGTVPADEVGRYTGTVRIAGARQHREALGLTRISHLPEKLGAEVGLKTSAPSTFRRVVPVSFAVVKPGTGLRDDPRDATHHVPPRWERPRTLRSHRRRRK